MAHSGAFNSGTVATGATAIVVYRDTRRNFL